MKRLGIGMPPAILVIPGPTASSLLKSCHCSTMLMIMRGNVSHVVLDQLCNAEYMLADDDGRPSCYIVAIYRVADEGLQPLTLFPPFPLIMVQTTSSS